MDQDGPAARVERTFWTVWYYITGAVSRFLRPEPANIASNDPNPVQESAVDSEPAEGDAGRSEVREEQPVANASLLSSSRPAVAWEPCTTAIDLRPDEESVRYKTQLSGGDESRASEEREGTSEEEFAQMGNDDAGLHIGKEDTESLRLTGEAMSEDMADAEEETERAVTPDDHQKMDHAMTKIQVKGDDNKMHHEDEQDLEEEEVDLCLEEEGNLHMEGVRVQKNEEDAAAMHEEVENIDGVLLLGSEKSDEGAKQVENQLLVCEELSDDNFKKEPGFPSLPVEQMAYSKSGIVSEDELIAAGQEHVIAHSSGKVEDAKEKEDGGTSDEGEQEENVKEAAINEALQQEDNVKTVTDGSEEEDILINRGEESEEAEIRLQTGEVTDGEQEDVAKDTEGQTKTRATDDVETESHDTVMDEKSAEITDISESERFEKNQVEEVACTTTSVTVKPEGETGQEREFKNIPLGGCEGQIVVLQELSSSTCEETKERLPEYNNEPGSDENTTQRFLEVGDSLEIQTTLLPEEVESKEPESLQNSHRDTGADCSLVGERMEEESTEDIKNNFDLVDAELPRETEKPLGEPLIQESGLLFVEEEGNVLVDSMKTGIEDSEKEFESDVGTDKARKELQDGTEELLVDVGGEADAAGDDRETTGCVVAEETVTDETLKFLEAEEQKMKKMSFFQESLDVTNSERNSNRTPSLLGDITDLGLQKESEPKVVEDSTIEMQDAGIDMEETVDGVEEKAAEDEIQNKDEMEILNLRVAGMEAELTAERNEKENALIALDLSGAAESKNQLSDEGLETSNEEMLTDAEAADESMTIEYKPDLTPTATEEKTTCVTESVAEETICSISGGQGVIDEEVLDLWIQALSEDTKQQPEGPETGPQTGTEIEPSNKEQDEVSSGQNEKDEDQLLEPELLSDTEMSSSTAESGFLDQSPGEWGAQNNQSISTGSFQGTYDVSANVSESADISELSKQQPNSESQDILIEETAEAGRLYMKEEESATETEEARHRNEESHRSQEEKTDEDTGSKKGIDAVVTDVARKTDWRDTEEEDLKSLTLFKAEKTKVEDEPLEITASDFPDEIQHTESLRSRSVSEASSEEGIVSTESGSKGDTCTELEKLLKFPSLDKPQPGWSEDITDSLPGLNKAEVAEQPPTKCEDHVEVDASALDFTAQRSRIAVKNPRVRPPKDPRSLLHMPSMDPMPASHLPVIVPVGVPLGGMGIGIKLPGLGAGFPVLKKTQQVVRDENSQDTRSQEPESKPEEKSDAPKQDEAQHKPKWMPPRHPGFGNPLMSELKTKLKKTPQE